MPLADLIALARAIAEKHSLDAALVCAIVEQESSWDAHAIRYEPAFRTRYVAPLGLPPTEEVARSMSWGLMQVMGQVAREHAFNGKFLTALCDPATGLDVACSVLVSKFAAAAAAQASAANAAALPEAAPQRCAGILPASLAPAAILQPIQPEAAPTNSLASVANEPLITRALELWNGGGNPNYAFEVQARIANYK